MSQSRNIDDHILHEIKEDLNGLYKTIYQGNGAPALTSQVAKLDQRISALEVKLDSSFKSIDTEISLKFKNITDVVNEKFNYISFQIANEFERRKSDSSGRWDYKKGILTAAIAAISSILAIVLTEVFSKI